MGIQHYFDPVHVDQSAMVIPQQRNRAALAVKLEHTFLAGPYDMNVSGRMII
jgi:hypothetical protein